MLGIESMSSARAVELLEAEPFVQSVKDVPVTLWNVEKWLSLLRVSEGRCTPQHVWRSGHNFQEPFLIFHFV